MKEERFSSGRQNSFWCDSCSSEAGGGGKEVGALVVVRVGRKSGCWVC